MFRRSPIIWQLSAIVFTIIVVAFAALIVSDAMVWPRPLQATLVGALAAALGALGTWFVVSRHLRRPLNELNEGMARIAGGDLGHRMDVRAESEFATAAASFNDMTAKLDLLIHRHRETRDFLEGIIESSADIIITVNRAGFILTFNTGAEIALGYARDEVINQPVEVLFADPQERDVAIARLKHADHVLNHETKFITKDRRIRDVMFSVSRLRGPYGFPIGTFAIGRDITNEKDLQRQVIQSERYAAIGQSFTAIQHSMKNMMNALSGGSYMVKIGLDKQDWAMLGEGWTMVSEGIDNIRDLSQNLLKYVRDRKPEFDSVAVGALIEKIQGVFSQTAADAGATLRVSIAPDLPHAHCDATLVHSALMDIVSNALEACESKEYAAGESPVIEIEATHIQTSERVCIEIGDNGPGMTDEVKALIFMPFFTTKKKKGTGLGLALTSRVVNLHGGSIDVISEPGTGTTFRVLLPVAGAEENKESRDGEEGAGH